MIIFQIKKQLTEEEAVAVDPVVKNCTLTLQYHQIARCKTFPQDDCVFVHYKDYLAALTPIVYLFFCVYHSILIIQSFWQRLSFNFNDLILKFKSVFFNFCWYLFFFAILKQVPETTEEIRQRTLREAAAEKAGEVIEYAKEKVEKTLFLIFLIKMFLKSYLK